MARHGNGEGTIYRRADGRWAATVELGARANGRRVRKTFYGATRREVHRRLTEAVRGRMHGQPIASDRLTLGAFLTEWLDSTRPSLRPRTWARYEQMVRLHVAPTLDRMPLTKLEPRHLQQLYADRAGAGAAPLTVRHLHAMLHRALGQAARWGHCARNVADLVDPPRAPRREIVALSPEQARGLVEAAAGDRLEALYVLAITTGMRQGELLGLRWRDVDLDSRALAVRASLQRVRGGVAFAEPKTAHSRRRVSLSDVAIAALRRRRTTQIAERLAAGSEWTDADVVFSTHFGKPLHASHVLALFHRLLERARLPRVRFHDLRHTAATLMLSRGVHPKVASEILGHSTIAITLDLYSHVTPTMQGEAAAALDAVLRAAP